MATMEVLTTTTSNNTTNNFQHLFDNLKSQKSLLTKCTDLYKTLNSHFTSIQSSIDSKTLTLESKLNSIVSSYQESLSELDSRENSIPSKLDSISSEIEEKKLLAIDEVQQRVNTEAPLRIVVSSYCKRMDHEGLMAFMIVKKKKKRVVFKDEIIGALKECIDPVRFVLESVKEYVKDNKKEDRIVEMRWACGVIVTGFFPPEKLKKNKKKGAEFSRKMVEEAEMIVRDWKANAGTGWDKMGPAESAMFLQVVVGFGLTGIFEEELYEQMVMDYCDRRDMAMLAIPIFGDKLPDFIDKMIKSGKEVEAVYFASEAGLTERFQPVSLLMSYLRNSKMKLSEILRNCRNDSRSTGEADTFELNYIRSIIRCVEDLKLESQYPIGSLRKRLSSLEKAKLEKRSSSKASARSSSSKRSRDSRTPSRSSGGRSPRPDKKPKYPSSYAKRDDTGKTYFGPTIYDTGLTASKYAQRFSAPVIQSTDQVTQQYYGVPAGSVPDPSAGSYAVPTGSVPDPSGGTQLGNSYGLQSAYGVYDYGATTTTSTYQPPSYAP